MDRIFELLDGVPVLPEEQIWWMIDHACRVDKLSFKILTIVLTVLATIASAARLFFRYRGERKLRLEDWLVAFATVCLIAETGLVISFTRMLYFLDAATIHLPVLAFIARDPTLAAELLSNGPSTLVAYFTLGWIAIFAIKFSFLALFDKMLRGVSSKLRAFYWCTVAATGMCGVVVILESFILCPHFGADAAQCFMRNNYTFSISSGVVVQCLDIVTDLLIVSIPIMILERLHLRLSHKLRIAVVLCLSGICIVLSIVRLAGGIERNVFGKRQFGTIWISFMLHCEAAVAVMAGSVPAFRAIYTSRQNRKPLSGSETEAAETFKSRVMSVFGSVRRPKDTLPMQERKRTSIARWRQSIIGFIPRRVSNKSHEPLTVAPEGRKDSADSAIIHPTAAYHAFRKQERNEIRVTYETTVSSESAGGKSWDMSEATSRTGTVISAPNSPENFNNFAFPEPVVSSRRVDLMIDEQFGRITAGMHI